MPGPPAGFASGVLSVFPASRERLAVPGERVHARSPAGAHVVGRRCAGVSGSRSTEARGHVASSAHRGTRGPQSSWDDGTHPSPVCLIPQRRGMLFRSLWVLCTGKAVPAGPDREPAGHRRGELRAPAALGTCRTPDPAELRLRPGVALACSLPWSRENAPPPGSFTQQVSASPG